MKKKRVAAVIGALAITSTLFTGCFASFQNQIAHDGSVIGTSKGDYIVINYGGNAIMDVYKLTDVFVESEKGSDGVRFVDNKGIPIIIQGDGKTLRMNNRNEFDKYYEYHREIDLIPYEQFVSNKLNPPKAEIKQAK